MPKDKLTEAMVLGTPVVALCGKVWVPSRDPEQFPVCPECKEIWESAPRRRELTCQNHVAKEQPDSDRYCPTAVRRCIP